MDLNIGLSEESREEISKGLSKVLANTYALYLKTQNFHWNLQGKEFYYLHLLFEKQYEELAEAVDEIAERIRMLGFYVDATFSGFKELSAIKEGKKVLQIKEMLLKLIEGHEVLISHARKVAAKSDEEGDFATVDLLSRRMGTHEKMLWFLRSHLH